MGRLAVTWLLGLGATAAPPGVSKLQRFEYSQVEMAVPVKIVVYGPDASAASKAARAAYGRIRHLNAVLSDYDPESELRRLSSTSGKGKAVPVSEELWTVLCHAQAVSERSQGAFDVTVGPVVRLWRRARRRQQLPSAERLQAARALVGYELVRLEPRQRTVELLKEGMRLDLGGIGKGYAGDQALAVLQKSGIRRALVDVGGDIRLGDPPPGRPGWHVGVARLDGAGPPRVVLSLSRVAVATSGDTWQYVEIDGRRYSHLVDPRTGLGLTDHSSVTIVAPDGITADGLASAVSVLGPEKGLPLVEDTPGAAARIVQAPQGVPRTYCSSRWKQLPTRSLGRASGANP